MNATPFTNAPRIRLRPGKKLATTGITNELADAVNSLRTLPPFGQKIEPSTAVQAAGNLPQPQYPGQVYQGRTNNAAGFEFVQLTPPVAGIPSPAV